MLDRALLEDLIEKFNAAKKEQAKLHELSKSMLKLKAIGLREPEKFFSELQKHIASGIKTELEISSIKKTAKSHIASYAIKGTSPADEILRILDKYYEGTPPRGFDWED